MNKNQGFTLIELLVVIAIIGILASVVLASLNGARKKGADAAIESNLNNMRPQAELYYSDQTPNSYSGVCSNAQMVKMETAANNAAGSTAGKCTEATAGASWSAWAPLKSDAAKAWCVDSTGTSKSITTSSAPTAGAACS